MPTNKGAEQEMQTNTGRKANPNGNKNASATKRGPGRFHEAGAPGNKLAKPRKVRAYQALLAAWASKRVTKTVRSDAHGSFTWVGRTWSAEAGAGRRVWLAGISAQRGF